MHKRPQLTSQLTPDLNVSQTRQILSQVLATSAKSFLLLSLGMMIGFPTVLIPVLTNKNNSGDLSFNGDEASWYGSLSYICQPAGAVLSGALLQSFGCKRLMILLNIPQFGCWLMVYYTSSKLVLYISSALVGFVIGLMEAPTIRYIGEISHPLLRGVLTTYSSTFTSVGFLIVYFLGSLMDWRHVALCSSLAPVICALAISQIPETPMWLMSKGRSEEALNSLQWLRGWTSAEMVKEEFKKLEFYAKKKTRSEIEEVDSAQHNKGIGNGVDDDDRDPSGNCVKNERFASVLEGNECRKRGIAAKLRDLTRKGMLVPLCKCMLLHSMTIGCGLLPLRPYLVKIFSQLELPVQANWTSVLVSLISILGNIGCMLLLTRVGKKSLAIVAFASCAFCLVFLALFIEGYTPTLMRNSNEHWWPLALFLVLFFSYNLALQPVPWIYLSELLPYRGRGIATGLVASSFYMIIFSGVKTFPTVEKTLGLQGIFFAYGAVSVAGIFFTYFFLPTTEGKFLSEIETNTIHGQQKYPTKAISV